jgi:23S rRNA (cytosine1962-C5)-methyltransferase
MLLETSKNFNNFELLDSGLGYRLERWNDVILQRPDPQIIWQCSLPNQEWEKAAAIFGSPSGSDKGRWEIKKPFPDPWIIKFGEVKFLLKLSPFKHTGLFAEQAAQWEWMLNRIWNSESGMSNGNKTQNSKLKILNLFAYTGGATMVLARAGCQVTHVDASKPAINWANENYKLNFGSEAPSNFARPSTDAQGEHPLKGNVRWILDDAVKFVKRELKRGSKYDGIIMDPPAFGHSPTGKTWKFNDDLPGLLADCVQLLSADAKFLIVNGYATNSSALALNNLLEDAVKSKPGSASWRIEFGELCLKQKNNRLISTGIFARWTS